MPIPVRIAATFAVLLIVIVCYYFIQRKARRAASIHTPPRRTDRTVDRTSLLDELCKLDRRIAERRALSPYSALYAALQPYLVPARDVPSHAAPIRALFALHGFDCGGATLRPVAQTAPDVPDTKALHAEDTDALLAKAVAAARYTYAELSIYAYRRDVCDAVAAIVCAVEHGRDTAHAVGQLVTLVQD